jgi:hypothetical protein
MSSLKKYKIGDVVRLKSLAWFDEMMENHVAVEGGLIYDMRQFFGKEQVISNNEAGYAYIPLYHLVDDPRHWNFSNDMIEGIASSFPEYVEKNYTPLIDEGGLYFINDNNDAYSLKEIYERYRAI